MTMTDRWRAVMMDSYGVPPLTLDHGRGVRVWDVDGRGYLDFVAGIAVSAVGHAHPAVVAAVCDQIARIAHTSNLAMHEPGVRLAERLVDLIGAPAKVFFANSGAEANECALKLARLHGTPSGRTEVVACHGSFHGRTLGALSVTGNPGKREPFEPLPGPVRFTDYGSVDQLRATVGERTAAVIVEPTLGEGGIVVPPADYLRAVREICDAAGALFVLDEVQSGIGRTGHWFACHAAGVRPDVVTLAKGLGGGLPIGACVGLGPAGELFAPGQHGSTFGGNPVSCAAALAVLDTIERDNLLMHVRDVGDHLAKAIDALGSEQVTVLRGAGLWRGVGLSAPIAAAVESAARERGLLVNAVRPDTIRLAPPLIVTTDEIDEGVGILGAALAEAAR
jgi:acetylornithine aminotransferase